jgi:hypothetical protein
MHASRSQDSPIKAKIAVISCERFVVIMVILLSFVSASRRSPVVGHCCESDFETTMAASSASLQSNLSGVGEEHQQLYWPAYYAHHEQCKPHCSSRWRMCSTKPNSAQVTPSSA